MDHKIDRRSLLALGVATVAGGGSPAVAQNAWPDQRISLLVGFAAGGYADSVARIIGQKLSERLKQTVVVQNMEGAGGNTAGRQVSVSPANGYTVLVTTTGLAINETLYKEKGFKADALTAIAMPVTAPESLTSNPKSDIKTLADAVREAKEGRVFLGTPGIGSGSHIAAEYFFKVLAKHDVKHIPFPGGSPAKQGLLSGDVNVLAATATTGIIPSIVSGEISGLAVASSERDPAIPAIPTFAELGFPDFLASSWVGFFAPSATPRPILERLNSAINEALNDADVRSKFSSLGTLLVSRSLDESQVFFKDEITRWAKMVQATGLSM